MSVLFEPINIGNVKAPNRFVHSATYEGMSFETGKTSDRLIKKYRNLAKGEVGLIITGHMYVHPLGRALKYQTGIHKNMMIPGLSKLTEAVHRKGGKIIFQLAHAGRQTTKYMIGQKPLGPSSKGRDPLNFVKPRKMDENQIDEAIRAFGSAAHRAVEAGADGIQLHAAHGYLINQFLSPFFNQRNDEWGGSDENRFRFLEEVFLAVKKAVPPGMPVLVKLSTHDHTPRDGIAPPLSAKYAGWLVELEVDGLEVSCGSSIYSFMNMCRGDVPVKELVSSLPFWKKTMGKFIIGGMAGKYGFKEGYNLQAAKQIKPVLGNIPLFVVGGLRKVSEMEKILEDHDADCISMSRPFIREPFVVKKIKAGKADAVACVSCNRCLAAVVRDIPVYCYNKGLPETGGS